MCACISFKSNIYSMSVDAEAGNACIQLLTNEDSVIQNCNTLLKFFKKIVHNVVAINVAS